MAREETKARQKRNQGETTQQEPNKKSTADNKHRVERKIKTEEITEISNMGYYVPPVNYHSPHPIGHLVLTLVCGCTAVVDPPPPPILFLVASAASLA